MSPQDKSRGGLPEILGWVFGAITLMLLSSFLLMALYNSVSPRFGLPTVSFFEALAVYLAVQLLRPVRLVPHIKGR